MTNRRAPKGLMGKFIRPWAPLILIVITACSSNSIRGNLVSRGPSSVPEKVIVDSDGAVFWDDGAAIAMLLQHPEKIKILGISMVLGNHWPYQGAEYIARVLEVAGRTDVPIYIGADHPLNNSKEKMVRLEEDLINQGVVDKSGFWKGAYSRSKEVRSVADVEPARGEPLSGITPMTKSAVEFIIDTLNGSTEPVTFVAIGPLTNLAQAIQKDRSIVSKIRRLVFMGGNIHVKGNTTPFAELNFLFDPEAAQIVISSGIVEKLMFPLDFCNQALITQDRYRELTLAEAPYAALLKADRGPKFKDSSYSVASWDTTVSAFLIDPSYVTGSEDLSLKVVEEFGPRYGSVQITSEKMNTVRVMSQMNFEKFFSILRADLTSSPKGR